MFISFLMFDFQMVLLKILGSRLFKCISVVADLGFISKFKLAVMEDKGN